MVAMAEMERAVTEVTVTDIRIMSQVNTETRQKGQEVIITRIINMI